MCIIIKYPSVTPLFSGFTEQVMRGTKQGRYKVRLRSCVPSVSSPDAARRHRLPPEAHTELVAFSGPFLYICKKLWIFAGIFTFCLSCLTQCSIRPTLIKPQIRENTANKIYASKPLQINWNQTALVKSWFIRITKVIGWGNASTLFTTCKPFYVSLSRGSFLQNFLQLERKHSFDYQTRTQKKFILQIDTVFWT